MSKSYAKLTTAIAGAVFASGAALAQDAGTGGTFDQSRFYMGLHVGGVWGEGDVIALPFPHESDASFTGGVLAGFEVVQGGWLFGAEADIGGRNSKIYDSLNPAFCISVCGVNWNGHVRGRLGYVMESTTLFVAGGLAIADFELGVLAPGSSTDDTKIGWTIGAGAQFEVNDRWDVRIEFLHDEYRDIGGSGYGGMDWSENTVRAAAIFKF